MSKYRWPSTDDQVEMSKYKYNICGFWNDNWLIVYMEGFNVLCVCFQQLFSYWQQYDIQMWILTDERIIWYNWAALTNPIWRAYLHHALSVPIQVTEACVMLHQLTQLYMIP